MFYQYASTIQMRKHAAPYHTPDPISWGHMYECVYPNACPDACIRQYLRIFAHLSVDLCACMHYVCLAIAENSVRILVTYSQVINGSHPLGATSSSHQPCCAKFL